jgi:predicted exporter
MAWLLSVLLAVTPLVPAQAAMLGNDQIITPAQSTQASGKLADFLGQESTRQQLLAWGVNPESVLERADSLTDAELARINQAIDLHAGGDSVLGILLIIFIVFIITDAIGATDIFPFVHPVR